MPENIPASNALPTEITEEMKKAALNAKWHHFQETGEFYYDHPDFTHHKNEYMPARKRQANGTATEADDEIVKKEDERRALREAFADAGFTTTTLPPPPVGINEFIADTLRAAQVQLVTERFLESLNKHPITDTLRNDEIEKEYCRGINQLPLDDAKSLRISLATMLQEDTEAGTAAVPLLMALGYTENPNGSGPLQPPAEINITTPIHHHALMQAITAGKYKNEPWPLGEFITDLMKNMDGKEGKARYPEGLDTTQSLNTKKAEVDVPMLFTDVMVNAADYVSNRHHSGVIVKDRKGDLISIRPIKEPELASSQDIAHNRQAMAGHKEVTASTERLDITFSYQFTDTHIRTLLKNHEVQDLITEEVRGLLNDEKEKKLIRNSEIQNLISNPRVQLLINDQHAQAFLTSLCTEALMQCSLEGKEKNQKEGKEDIRQWLNREEKNTDLPEHKVSLRDFTEFDRRTKDIVIEGLAQLNIAKKFPGEQPHRGKGVAWTNLRNTKHTMSEGLTHYWEAQEETFLPLRKEAEIHGEQPLYHLRTGHFAITEHLSSIFRGHEQGIEAGQNGVRRPQADPDETQWPTNNKGIRWEPYKEKRGLEGNLTWGMHKAAQTETSKTGIIRWANSRIKSLRENWQDKTAQISGAILNRVASGSLIAPIADGITIGQFAMGQVLTNAPKAITAHNQVAVARRLHTEAENSHSEGMIFALKQVVLSNCLKENGIAPDSPEAFTKFRKIKEINEPTAGAGNANLSSSKYQHTPSRVPPPGDKIPSGSWWR